MGSLGNYSGATGKEVESGNSAVILIRAPEPLCSALACGRPAIATRRPSRNLGSRAKSGGDSTQANFDVVNRPVVNQRHA